MMQESILFSTPYSHESYYDYQDNTLLLHSNALQQLSTIEGIKQLFPSNDNPASQFTMEYKNGHLGCAMRKQFDKLFTYQSKNILLFTDEVPHSDNIAISQSKNANPIVFCRLSTVSSPHAYDDFVNEGGAYLSLILDRLFLQQDDRCVHNYTKPSVSFNSQNENNHTVIVNPLILKLRHADIELNPNPFAHDATHCVETTFSHCIRGNQLLFPVLPESAIEKLKFLDSLDEIINQFEYKNLIQRLFFTDKKPFSLERSWLPFKTLDSMQGNLTIFYGGELRLFWETECVSSFQEWYAKYWIDQLCGSIPSDYTLWFQNIHEKIRNTLCIKSIGHKSMIF